MGYTVSSWPAWATTETKQQGKPEESSGCTDWPALVALSCNEGMEDASAGLRTGPVVLGLSSNGGGDVLKNVICKPCSQVFGGGERNSKSA